jgi:hypothetical protein
VIPLGPGPSWICGPGPRRSPPLSQAPDLRSTGVQPERTGQLGAISTKSP